MRAELADAFDDPATATLRLPGRTKGRPVVMPDGTTWHLPAVDDSIVPLLPRLVGPADDVIAAWHAARAAGDPKARPLMVAYAAYLILALGVQYDLPVGVALAMAQAVADDREGRLARAAHRFITDLTKFATFRVPRPSRAAVAAN